MTHFHIRHIDDVLPHVDGRGDFIVVHKDGYSVIDYVYALPDSFDHPARVECRGIKFAPDGTILARPLHKFMNIGQTPALQPQLIDFTQPHVIMEKLDGSMIHPAIVAGEVVFMTRMGRTDVALKAERHLTSRLAASLRGADALDLTPIFEWTAPDNRIVVRYNESALTLLAVRIKEDGRYADRDLLAAFADDMRVPLVAHHSPQHTSAADFLAYARAIQNAEGFVVRFDNGLWVKAKGDDYVLKHRAKDSITQEKNILALVLNGGLDDVLPLLDEADAEAARAYAASVEAGLAKSAEAIARTVHATRDIDQKRFAVEYVPQMPPHYRSIAFQVRAGKRPEEVIRARLAANCNSSSKVEEYRALHGAKWAA